MLLSLGAPIAGRPVEADPRDAPASPVLCAQDVQVDLGGHLLWVAGRRVPVGRRELALAAVLVASAGVVVPRDRLEEAIWPGRPAPAKGLDVLVRRLRCRIEPDPHHPRYVRTVRGVGYVFDR